jgi:diguanylate cyclase (GGDEF)-like protein
VGEKVEASAARTVQQVTKSLSSDTHESADGLAAVVTVPVALGSSTYAFEVVRSTADLRQQLSDLRWTLLGTLGLGLPFGLVLFYIVGARSYGTRLHRALEDSATDGLTGLRNHREFHEELRRRVDLARRHGRSLSLALIDLDGFKAVNDTSGHRAGDRVLAKVGLLLRDGRPEDLPFRTGGDEFALLLPETDVEGAQIVAERIREQVEAHIDGVTTSIGIVDLTVQVPDGDALIEAADAALYVAKRQGRNRVVRSSIGQDEPAASAV